MGCARYSAIVYPGILGQALRGATTAIVLGAVAAWWVVGGPGGLEAGAAGSPLPAQSGGPHYCCISGIYPHLAVFNQPADPAERPQHGECGIGAMAVWQGRLWYLTYPQHKTAGSNDKLYELDAGLEVRIRPESVGGTHAGRMIHRPSQQLILGPYFIDAQRNVRAADLWQLRGRMTAVMAHLHDPARKVYFFDMEGALYEVDVYTRSAVKLFEKAVPGWHGKGGYTAQGRVVIANNGESGPKEGYRKLLVGGPAQGEEAGVLAEWEGRQWRIVERKQFCEVTGPGGLEGAPNEHAPLWAVGWDKRSVILKVLDEGQWFTFRLPKGSHTFDPRHGWYTEWPRIRQIDLERFLLAMDGQLFDFPPAFSARSARGIRPLCTHLRVIPDFCAWLGRIVLGADDASMMQNPLCGQAQSNLWFGSREDLQRWGPAGGWGGPWLRDPVTADCPSDPYLFAGYRQRTVHMAHDAPHAVRFRLETGPHAAGQWQPLATVEVPSGQYRYLVLPEDAPGEWIRAHVSAACRATVYFHYASPRPAAGSERHIFAALAGVEGSGTACGGIIRPAAHNRNLQFFRQASAGQDLSAGCYWEVDITPWGQPTFVRPGEDRREELERLGRFAEEYTVDAASVIVRDTSGRRFRLPKGDTAFDAMVGRARGVRECATERFLANLHGTFYEIPRADGGRPDWQRIKPVASHDRAIFDFCLWRGLLVLAGARSHAPPDGHAFTAADGSALWFGALDDLWKLGKPRGRGGPWLDTPVEPGKPSDPYLMTGFDRKTLLLSHDVPGPVIFGLEVDFDHHGFHRLKDIPVPAHTEVRYEFPAGFHAHWLRLKVDKPCRATARLLYE